jgi:uncharacterized DUF497 family protein
MYILNMVPQFEWDAAKASRNRNKHRITFEAAVTAFDDPLQLRSYDATHATAQEERETLVGRMDNGVIVTIVFTQRWDAMRLISARRAQRPERTKYYENEKAHHDRPG